MKLAIVVINKNGEKIARKIASGFADAEIFTPLEAGHCSRPTVAGGSLSLMGFALNPGGKLADLVGSIFDKTKFEGLVFIMAAGIVVRLAAPYLRDKYHDPAVVVVDDYGRFAVSLLCGHEGRANELAFKIAGIIGAEPVITTATQTRKNIILGIGCRRGIKKEEVLAAIRAALKKSRQSLSKVRCAATVDLKKDETGLKEALAELGLAVIFVPAQRIKNFKGQYQRSALVRNRIGVEGVCEPCALLAGRRARLILKKQIFNGVTVAIARED